MAPSKAPSSWDDEDSESTPPSSPPVIARRSKFDDEEDDSDVLESWDAAEDSEVEREKEKKATEAKAKAEAEAKASHKSKTQRIEEKRQEAMRRKMEDELDAVSSEDEDESDKRARLRALEKESDLQNAEDLFGGIAKIGVSDKRGAVKPVTVQESEDPASAIDLSTLKLFNPTGGPSFTKLRETLVPLLTANSKKPQYALFLPEFVKQLSRDLTSEQMKKIASALTAQSNEKMKEEKASEKGGKKTKAAKTKASLSANRNVTQMADTTAYDDGGLDDGDFM